jgi:lysophospholipase L1-like esterase
LTPPPDPRGRAHRRARHAAAIVILGAALATPALATGAHAAAALVRPACAGTAWRAAWAAAPSDAGPSYAAQSLRLILTPLRGGRVLRVRLSNRFGDQPVTFDAAFLGKQLADARLVAGSSRPLRFAGAASVTIAAGAEVVSDPVRLPFRAFERLAVSLDLRGEIAAATQHAEAAQTSFFTATGDGGRAAREDAAGFTGTTISRPFVTGVDVLAPRRVGVVAAVGDSITDGTQSDAQLRTLGIDEDARYPDFLARRIAASRHGRRLTVINLGIGGNRVLRDYILPFAGPALLARLEADVLAREDVTDVILLEGINDLGTPPFPGAAELIDGLERAVRTVRTPRDGRPPLHVLVGTLTPAGSAILPTYVAAEEERQKVNAYIRTSGIGDGVVDFDRALRDPVAPSRLAAAYDNGDGLHPSSAGYARMADEVDLALLAGRDCGPPLVRTLR